MGYSQSQGGQWNGDLLVVDWERLDGADRASEVPIYRIKAKEVFHVKCEGRSRFPLAENALRQPSPGQKRAARPKYKPIDWQAGNPCDVVDAEDDKGDSEDVSEVDDAGGDSCENQDFWTLTDDTLVCHHITPRTSLFNPESSNCPIPTKWLDVMRVTKTDLETDAEARVEDNWYGSDDKELSSPWTGKTIFDLLRPKPPPGHQWVEGRLTKMQATTRPGHIWPEFWRTFSKKQKKKARQEWEVIGAERNKLRTDRGIFHVKPEELDDYTKVLAEKRLQLSIPAAPAMPLCHYGASSPVAGQPTPDSAKLSEHQGNIASRGFTSADYFWDGSYSCFHAGG